MKFTLSAITLVCAAIQQAGLAQAGNDGSLSLLSKRSTNHILEQHDIRRRHHAKKDTLRKRGACPARNAASGSSGETVPVRGAAGKPEASTTTVEEQAAVPPSTAPASTSSKKDDPAPPAPTATKAAQPKPAEQPKPQEPKPEQPKPEPKPEHKPEPQNNSGNADAALGQVSAFHGINSGIGSWFRTNAGSDSTNGESWCETQYQDDWLCFAPSVGTMLKNFGYNREAAAKAYCGREYKVTNPANGKSVNAFLCDGFDDKWVLSPGSIDMSIALFTALTGGFDNNKNNVVKGVTWEATGNVVKAGTFRDSEKQW